jgi:hypothetical protein
LVLAKSTVDPAPLFVLAQALRMIATDWDDRPLSATVAEDTKSAIVPAVQALLDEMIAWPGSLAIPQLMSELVRALFGSDYQNTSLT